MAYIDKVKRGKKTFYYLGKTIRTGPHSWKKLRVALGEKRPSKVDIASKIKDLKLEQYDVYNEEYIEAEKLEIIDDFKEVYNQHRKKVPKTVLEKEELDFIIRFTYNSNAIEGNRLTLRDTFLVIKEKQIPSGAPPKDYVEAMNGRSAYKYFKEYKGKLTIEFLEKMNEIITKNTGVVYPGRIRFFPIKIEGTDFKPPEPKKVKPQLRKMIEFYNKNTKKIHPFVLASLIHAQFVEIHPFEDGNGRTGRTLMNWILLQAKYPKLFIPVKKREKYYHAIDAHNDKEYKKYCTMMFEIIIEQLKGDY